MASLMGVLGRIKVTDATSVTSSKVWTMGARVKRDCDHAIAWEVPSASRGIARAFASPPNGEADTRVAPQGPRKHEDDYQRGELPLQARGEDQ